MDKRKFVLKVIKYVRVLGDYFFFMIINFLIRLVIFVSNIRDIIVYENIINFFYFNLFYFINNLDY